MYLCCFLIGTLHNCSSAFLICSWTLLSSSGACLMLARASDIILILYNLFLDPAVFFGCLSYIGSCLRHRSSAFTICSWAMKSSSGACQLGHRSSAFTICYWAMQSSSGACLILARASDIILILYNLFLGHVEFFVCLSDLYPFFTQLFQFIFHLFLGSVHLILCFTICGQCFCISYDVLDISSSAVFSCSCALSS